MWAPLSTWWASLARRRAAPANGWPGAGRWLVVDVESSGLDPARDRLLAIAAVAVHFDEDFRHPRIELGDAFEVLLRQARHHTEQADKANILIHGIGVGAQRRARPAQEALQAWSSFAADSPLVGYHSAFDQAMIDRAMQAAFGRVLPNPWLDLEHVAALVHQDPRPRPLDHWLKRQGIHCLIRHQAAADALATAELMLSLWPKVRARLDGRFSVVADWAQSHRFMAGRPGSR